jgi:hypothetical protein
VSASRRQRPTGGGIEGPFSPLRTLQVRLTARRSCIGSSVLADLGPLYDREHSSIVRIG